MVELLANGSRTVTGVVTIQDGAITSLPSGPKGRLHAFVSDYLVDCRFRTYGELEQHVRDVTFAQRVSLPYDPGRAATKIMSRWQQVDEDGYFVIRPDFAYCS